MTIKVILTSPGCWWHHRIQACRPQWDAASLHAPQSPPSRPRSAPCAQSSLFDKSTYKSHIKQDSKNKVEIQSSVQNCLINIKPLFDKHVFRYLNCNFLSVETLTCSTRNDPLWVEISEEQTVDQRGLPQTRLTWKQQKCQWGNTKSLYQLQKHWLHSPSQRINSIMSKQTS